MRRWKLRRLQPRSRHWVGRSQLRHGDIALAAASLRRAVAVDPAYALGHLNLGLALQRLDQPAGARASYERALAVDPHLVQARLQLSALMGLADPDAARREHDRALESAAINFMTVRRHEEAIPLWTRLIDSGALIPNLVGMRFHCQLQCCDWSRYQETADLLEAQVLTGRQVDLPFSFFVYSHSAAAQLQCSRTYAARYTPVSAPSALSARDEVQPPPAQDGRMKIAYLSFDFHEHATAYLMAGLFERHDRSRFEITALSFGQDDGSAMRARLAGSIERFVDVSGYSDIEVVALIQRLGIHIAVDLKGFTGGARTGIFASRPAPLQVNFLGYPGTLGAAYIDYIVADHHLIPPGEEIHYSERVIYMPDSYQPNDEHRPLPHTVPDREELGLPTQGFVFCSFNNLYKITPSVWAAWMDLLGVVDGSVLWLLEGTQAAMHNLRSAAAAARIDSARILFAPHLPLTAHLARYRHANLFLDTTPCNAHTTASDALWMAVPVLTMTGQTFAGRVATSLLHAVGLPQLCTTSLAEYVATAARLAADPVALLDLRRHLEHARGTSSLFDTARYVRHLEAAYLDIFEAHGRGEPPAHWPLQNVPRTTNRIRESPRTV
jgi:protein O-GlcNAc transferase